jgi:hypothetical protein
MVAIKGFIGAQNNIRYIEKENDKLLKDSYGLICA